MKLLPKPTLRELTGYLRAVEGIYNEHVVVKAKLNPTIKGAIDATCENGCTHTVYFDKLHEFYTQPLRMQYPGRAYVMNEVHTRLKEQAEVRAHRHMLDALRGASRESCNRSNCGTVCLCTSCHARKALEFYDPDWRP